MHEEVTEALLAGREGRYPEATSTREGAHLEAPACNPRCATSGRRSSSRMPWPLSSRRRDQTTQPTRSASPTLRSGGA